MAVQKNGQKQFFFRLFSHQGLPVCSLHTLLQLVLYKIILSFFRFHSAFEGCRCTLRPGGLPYERIGDTGHNIWIKPQQIDQVAGCWVCLKHYLTPKRCHLTGIGSIINHCSGKDPPRISSAPSKKLWQLKFVAFSEHPEWGTPLRETMIIPDFSYGSPPPAFARATPGVIPSLVQTWKFMFVCLTTDFNAARRASKADAHRTGQERWTAGCWEGMWMSVALKNNAISSQFFPGETLGRVLKLNARLLLPLHGFLHRVEISYHLEHLKWQQNC